MRLASKKKSTILSLIATTWIISCGSSKESEGLSETSALVHKRNLWSSHTIPVCWVNGDATTSKQQNWVREAVRREYERKTPFRFVGWQNNCDSTYGPAIRIEISDRRGSSVVGRSTTSPSMHFSATHRNFMNWCRNSEDSLRKCIEGSSLHEFGHAIGLFHEQDRSDSSCDMSSSNTGGQHVGPYDRYSIMNYCNRSLYTDPKLSAGDIAGIQYIANLISRAASN